MCRKIKIKPHVRQSLQEAHWMPRMLTGMGVVTTMGHKLWPQILPSPLHSNIRSSHPLSVLWWTKSADEKGKPHLHLSASSASQTWTGDLSVTAFPASRCGSRSTPIHYRLSWNRKGTFQPTSLHGAKELETKALTWKRGPCRRVVTGGGHGQVNPQRRLFGPCYNFFWKSLNESSHFQSQETIETCGFLNSL